MLGFVYVMPLINSDLGLFAAMLVRWPVLPFPLSGSQLSVMGVEQESLGSPSWDAVNRSLLITT